MNNITQIFLIFLFIFLLQLISSGNAFYIANFNDTHIQTGIFLLQPETSRYYLRDWGQNIDFKDLIFLHRSSSSSIAILDMRKYCYLFNDQKDYYFSASYYDSPSSTTPDQTSNGFQIFSMFWSVKPPNLNDDHFTVVGCGFVPKSSIPNDDLDVTMTFTKNNVNYTSKYIRNVDSKNSEILLSIPPGMSSGRGYIMSNCMLPKSRGSSCFVGKDYDRSVLNLNFASPNIIELYKTNDGSGNWAIHATNIYTNDNEKSKLKLFFNNVSSPIISSNDTTIIFFQDSAVGPTQFSVQLDFDNNPSTIVQMSILPIVKEVSTAPKIGGDVTIKGLNFIRGFKGNNFPTTITLGSQTCNLKQTSIDSEELIVCNLPGGFGLVDVPVKVIINNFASNTDVLFTQGVPNITQCNQQLDMVTCTGYNFDNPLKLQFPNGSIVNTPTSKDTEFSFSLNNTIDQRSGNLQVFSSIKNSSSYPIIFKSFLLTVTLTPTSGGVITITGKALSPKTSSNLDVPGYKISYQYKGKEVICGNIVDLTNDRITCQTQPGGGVNLPFSITTSGGVSNGLLLSYNKPVILDYYQIVNGFYINGTDLGSKNAEINFTANYGGTELTSVDYNPINEFEPVVRISTESVNDQLYLTVEGQKSNSINIDIKPTISNISIIPTSGGLVTVDGFFFNTNDPNNISFVTQGDIQCTNLTIVSPKKFFCNAPPGYGKNRPITLKVNNKTTSDRDPIINLSYEPPNIDSSTSANYTGGLITIVGSNFFYGSTNVTIGEESPVSCDIRNIIDYRIIVCYLKEWNNDDGILKNETYLVTVEVGDQSVSKYTYKWGLEGYDYGISKDKPKKWLVAAIVIPVAASVLALGTVVYILIKKHRKFKKLNSVFNKK